MANKWGREEEEEEFGEEEKKVPGFVSHPTRRNYARTFQEARRPKHWSLERSSPPQTHARFETSQQSLFNWHEDRHVYTTNWSVPSQATPPISFPFISFPVLIFGYPSDPPLSALSLSLSYAIYIDNFTLDVASISTRSSYSSRVEGFVWIPERSGGEKGGKRLSTGEDKIGNQWNYGPQREEDKIGQQTNQSVDSDPNWRNETREKREKERDEKQKWPPILPVRLHDVLLPWLSIQRPLPIYLWTQSNENGEKENFPSQRKNVDFHTTTTVSAIPSSSPSVVYSNLRGSSPCLYILCAATWAAGIN